MISACVHIGVDMELDNGYMVGKINWGLDHMSCI